MAMSGAFCRMSTSMRPNEKTVHVRIDGCEEMYFSSDDQTRLSRRENVSILWSVMTLRRCVASAEVDDHDNYVFALQPGFLSGATGSGKTHEWLRRMMAQDAPDFLVTTSVPRVSADRALATGG